MNVAIIPDRLVSLSVFSWLLDPDKVTDGKNSLFEIFKSC